mmetsp:Transcript_18566/g.57660  ORF Transcript_18566/g.57660 Transcript_18566/m.57660 type:complete len:211 (+) Transcript_18566:22-654(+)
MQWDEHAMRSTVRRASYTTGGIAAVCPPGADPAAVVWSTSRSSCGRTMSSTSPAPSAPVGTGASPTTTALGEPAALAPRELALEAVSSELKERSDVNLDDVLTRIQRLLRFSASSTRPCCIMQPAAMPMQHMSMPMIAPSTASGGRPRMPSLSITLSPSSVSSGMIIGSSSVPVSRCGGDALGGGMGPPLHTPAWRSQVVPSGHKFGAPG